MSNLASIIASILCSFIGGLVSAAIVEWHFRRKDKTIASKLVPKLVHDREEKSYFLRDWECHDDEN